MNKIKPAVSIQNKVDQRKKTYRLRFEIYGMEKTKKNNKRVETNSRPIELCSARAISNLHPEMVNKTMFY